jgi:type VI secretion system secreted protein VgrG
MAYTQDNSPFAVTTPLGKDIFLLTGFSGHEAISQLFNFQLDVAVDNAQIGKVLDAANSGFANVLGQSITIEIRLRGKKRYINGICNRVTQGDQDSTFTYFRLEMVPKIWLLTKRIDSRIFQTLSVPDILAKVFTGYTVTYKWNAQADFKKRDYCVQYRETDFNFACRLMEEEGIHYYFTHADGSHSLNVTDFPGHTGIGVPITYLTSATADTLAKTEAVVDWRRMQELRSGKYTLADHCFEKQDGGKSEILTNTVTIPAEVQVGGRKHKLKLAPIENLEMYEYPGEFAQRFDGIDPSGGVRAADLANLGPDGARTTKIRMEEEASAAVLIAGTGNSPLFCPGFTFTRTAQDKPKEAVLKNDGEYLLAGVAHFASGPGYRSATGAGSHAYHNSFTCVPTSVTFRRPPRATPKPFVQGSQTAIVVGPTGQEIFTDKYGRVKVQFFWDRLGQRDAASSCWVRVAQAWAGKQWGAFFWPRIGQEVVVTFLEGDPDQPLIIGSVYNAMQMPPYTLPDKQMVTGVKSNDTLGGTGFNEWRFDDTKGTEQVFFHAERNMDTRVKNDSNELVIHDRSLIVGQEKDGAKTGDQKEKVFKDKHLRVLGNHQELIAGDMKLMVGHGGNDAGGNLHLVVEKNKYELIEKETHLHVKTNQGILVDGFVTREVKGDQAEKIGGEASLEVVGELAEKVTGNQSLTSVDKYQHKVGSNHAVEAGTEIHLKGGQKVIIEAGSQISLKVGGNFIDISASGVSIVGSIVNINSGGSAGSGAGCSPKDVTAPTAPTDATQAAPVDPTVADNAASGQKSLLA